MFSCSSLLMKRKFNVVILLGNVNSVPGLLCVLAHTRDWMHVVGNPFAVQQQPKILGVKIAFFS